MTTNNSVGKRKYESDILNHEQIFYDSIDEVEACYPTDIFPENGKTQDAKSAMMARTTCNNIRKTYERRKHEYYESQPLSPQSAEGVEEILLAKMKETYPDFDLNRMTDGYRNSIIAAMTEYSQLKGKEKDREIERLKELVIGLFKQSARYNDPNHSPATRVNDLNNFKIDNHV